MEEIHDSFYLVVDENNKAFNGYCRPTTLKSARVNKTHIIKDIKRGYKKAKEVKLLQYSLIGEIEKVIL